VRVAFGAHGPVRGRRGVDYSSVTTFATFSPDSFAEVKELLPDRSRDDFGIEIVFIDCYACASRQVILRNDIERRHQFVCLNCGKLNPMAYLLPVPEMVLRFGLFFSVRGAN